MASPSSSSPRHLKVSRLSRARSRSDARLDGSWRSQNLPEDPDSYCLLRDAPGAAPSPATSSRQQLTQSLAILSPVATLSRGATGQTSLRTAPPPPPSGVDLGVELLLDSVLAHVLRTNNNNAAAACTLVHERLQYLTGLSLFEMRRIFNTANGLPTGGGATGNEIPFEDIRLGAKIGEGAFGEVFKGTLWGKEVAVKKLKVKNINEKILKELREEVAIMSALRHPNICLYIGACTKPPHMCMVTELLDCGNLYNALRDDRLNPPILVRMAKDVAQGMSYLHSRRPSIIHRDLKTLNLLVDHNFNVKVGDFGVSIMRQPSVKSVTGASPYGTVLYMAPEVIFGPSFDEKADCFSFGVVLFEMYYVVEHPDTDFVRADSVGYAMLHEPLYQKQQPKIPSHWPAPIVALIRQCLSTTPAERPAFTDIVDILNHVESSHILSWGSNLHGQLGLMRSGDQAVPRRLNTIHSSYLDFAFGSNFTVGLAASGYVYAWGSKSSPAAAPGTPDANTLRPIAPGSGGTGSGRTRAVSNANAAAAAAAASAPALEEPTSDEASRSASPTPLSPSLSLETMPGPSRPSNDPVARVRGLTPESVSGDVFLGRRRLSTNKPSRSSNSWGGAGDTSDNLKPRRLLGLERIVQVAAGKQFALALDADGAVYQWSGAPNAAARTLITAPIPTAVSMGRQVTQIACGAYHALAITETGLVAWGSGAHGQLGNGESADAHKPVAVVGLDDAYICRIAAGGSHSAALNADGHLYTWGSGSSGQLGHNDTKNQLVPRAVAAFSDIQIQKVACGARHTVALTDEGDVYTFGLFVGHNYNLAPTLVETLFGIHVVDIASGDSHFCCLTDTHAVFACGTNNNGQLGLEHFESVGRPRLVTSLVRSGELARQVICGAACTSVFSTGSLRLSQIKSALTETSAVRDTARLYHQAQSLCLLVEDPATRSELIASGVLHRIKVMLALDDPSSPATSPRMSSSAANTTSPRMLAANTVSPRASPSPRVSGQHAPPALRLDAAGAAGAASGASSTPTGALANDEEHHQRAEIRSMATCVLSTLAEDPAFHAVIVQNIDLPWLLGLITSTDDNTARYIARTVRNMSGSAAFGTDLVAMGMAALVDILKGDDWSTLAHREAAGALARLIEATDLVAHRDLVYGEEILRSISNMGESHDILQQRAFCRIVAVLLANAGPTLQDTVLGSGVFEHLLLLLNSQDDEASFRAAMGLCSLAGRADALLPSRGELESIATAASVIVQMAEASQHHQERLIRGGGLVSLSLLLTSGSQELQRMASRALGTLAENQENHTALIRHGVLNMLLRLVTNTTSDTRRLAARCLANLSENSRVVGVMYEQDAFPQLMLLASAFSYNVPRERASGSMPALEAIVAEDHMRHSSGSHSPVEPGSPFGASLGSFGSLNSLPVAGSSFGAGGGESHRVSASRRLSASRDVISQRYATRALANLAQELPEVRVRMLHARGCLQALLYLMSSADLQIRREVLRIIDLVAGIDAHGRRLIVAAGAVKPLMVVAKSDSDLELETQAACVLANLADNDRGMQTLEMQLQAAEVFASLARRQHLTLIDRGGLYAIISLLHSRLYAVREHACQTVRLLTANREDAVAFLVLGGVVAPLVKLLLLNETYIEPVERKQHLELAQVAVACLAVICEGSEEARGEVVELSGLDALAHLLLTSRSPETQTHSAAALASVSESQEHHTDLLERCRMDLVAKVVASASSPDTKLHLARLLTNFCLNPEVVDACVADGVLEILTSLGYAGSVKCQRFVARCFAELSRMGTPGLITKIISAGGLQCVISLSLSSDYQVQADAQRALGSPLGSDETALVSSSASSGGGGDSGDMTTFVKMLFPDTTYTVLRLPLTTTLRDLVQLICKKKGLAQAELCLRLPADLREKHPSIEDPLTLDRTMGSVAFGVIRVCRRNSSVGSAEELSALSASTGSASYVRWDEIRDAEPKVRLHRKSTGLSSLSAEQVHALNQHLQNRPSAAMLVKQRIIQANETEHMSGVSLPSEPVAREPSTPRDKARRRSIKRTTSLPGDLYCEDDRSSAELRAIHSSTGSSGVPPVAPIKEGYMMKQGGTIRTWKRRWFVLNNGELQYFRDFDDKVPIGVIRLAGGHVEVLKGSSRPSGHSIRLSLGSRPYTFQILHPENSRVFVLSTASQAELDRWVSVLQTAAAT